MLWTLFKASLKMLVRNRQGLFWALIYPLIFVVVFGLFRFDQPTTSTIAVVDNAQDPVSSELVKNLGTVSLLKLEPATDEASARKELEDGKVGFVLVIPNRLAAGLQSGSPVPLTLLYNEAQVQQDQMVVGVIQQFLGQVNMSLQDAKPLLTLEAQGLRSRHFSYFDFVLPGLVGMAVMTYSIIGLGSQLALYREQKVLKRLLTTPLRVSSFFVAQVLAHLVLALAQAAIILAVGVFIFHGHVYGNLLWLLLLVLVGNLIFLNLGFVVGSLAANVRSANGLANVIAMPMMFFSGVFFPTASLPWVLPHVVALLPLTPMLDALRGVMLDSKALWAFPWELGLLGLWVLVTSVLAVRVFRFN